MNNSKTEKNNITVNQIIAEKCFDELWGSTLEEYDYNIKDHIISMTLKVVENGVVNYYQLIFHDVIEFSIQHDTVQPGWDYIDVSSAEIQQQGRQFKVILELWESGMYITCLNVEMKKRQYHAHQ